ncbi:uncharacterized protein Z518_05489 [Rhinocladiella mackenziei CBS 650.93]|uniref:Nuclear envelope protein n=1 Tax=Rhinocladiella mackenziei CBS 650.93 TaxID=1442369 RepID=A0A0D2IFM7_9EURO|nr:uncharacterized protein Z518_05489 [Rhinocladiella mackenziei CBS 650.93]KIX04619.1 hypothetical protein Z518_05489 [Rhinocladiella mackenziei CBS 650.93]
MAIPASTPLASLPPRPYRRFLTSALHTRFVHAALISLLVALNNAFWIGSKRDLFWSWFPFGPAGIKALLFFMSSLFIFILQIATLRIGRQTTTSPFATFIANFLSSTALQTAFWYLVSAWWFTEAYIWSSPDLGWITRGNHKTPDVLNEKPIFFRLYALVLASAYSAIHLYQGHSLLHIPVSRLPTKPSTDSKAPDTHPIEPIQTQLQRRIIPSLAQSAVIAAVAIVATPFINTLGLRQFFWQLHLTLAKPFFNLSRANARPIGYPPLGLFYLGRCLLAGFWLVLTWELTSMLFLTYLKQEPSKTGLPLSATSKDPNGTLLTGLKAKRDVVKTFAFWELDLIAQKHKDRRKAIFEDIERPTGPIWGQTLEAGLKVLRDIDSRITGPPPKEPDPQPNQTVKTLPHIVPELPTRSILQAKPKASMGELLVSSPLRQIGRSKNPWHLSVEQTTKVAGTKLLEYAKPPGADKMPSQSLLGQWAISLQKSPLGWLFLSTKAAKINAAVLGSPSGNAAMIVDVIDSITKMLVASLSEDTYGKATPTVPETVRTFTKTLTIIDSFVLKNSQGLDGGIEEVEIITERLRSGLKELLSAFQLYLLDVGLGIAELNQAKRAVEIPQSEEAEDKAVEPAHHRQLFSNDIQKGKPSKRQRGTESQETRPTNRLEAGPGTSGTSRGALASQINGRLNRKREMEQIR